MIIAKKLYLVVLILFGAESFASSPHSPSSPRQDDPGPVQELHKRVHDAKEGKDYLKPFLWPAVMLAIELSMFAVQEAGLARAANMANMSSSPMGMHMYPMWIAMFAMPIVQSIRIGLEIRKDSETESRRPDRRD